MSGKKKMISLILLHQFLSIVFPTMLKEFDDESVETPSDQVYVKNSLRSSVMDFSNVT